MDFKTFIIKENESSKGKITHLPKLKPIADKEFFKELKEHVFYWFNYDFLKEKWSISSLENDIESVEVWFNDKDNKDPYEYKVLFKSIEKDPLVEKVEKVTMTISIYNNNDNSLLKQTDMEVGLEYINADSFNKFIEKTKKRIIKVPKSDEDVKDFKKKEVRRLGDNIY